MIEATITLYGKKDCGKCESAKDKLKKMKLQYRYVDITKILTAEDLPEDWRDKGYEEIMANYLLLDTLPIFKLDEVAMDYATAMKTLKEMKKEEVKRLEAIPA